MKIRSKKSYGILLFAIVICLLQGYGNNAQAQLSGDKPQVSKIKDVVIYEDTIFYASFPSVVKRPNGEFLVAFRRAPNRLLYGERYSHIDLNSYLVTVRSRDGENWTKEPDLIYAYPFGGSQDPCLLQLRDGTLLCASYAWTLLAPKADKSYASWQSMASFLGGYILRSTDGGNNWSSPIYPINVPTDKRINILGKPLPAYNRGAMYEGKSGRIFWAVAASKPTRGSDVHLMTSDDKGLTWDYNSVIASDSVANFNETSVYETPKGDIVAFLRTANYDDQACIARSTDGGKSFKWESMRFQGHPLNALRLPDNRVLLTYGYRHQPFGIRVRVLNEECTDFATSEEFVLRDDGGNVDIGYTWPVLLDKNRVLVTYYFNKNDGARHIAGTIIEIKSSPAQKQANYTVNKIWDSAQHSAFTDLIKYGGKYYCTFREGTGHIPAKDGTGDGQIRVLVSEDGNSWKSAALIAKEGFDLRDPKLSITPDGRLMVLIGGSVYKNGQCMSQAPYASFTDKKGQTFTDPQPLQIDPSIKADTEWLWRVTWDKKIGYGVLYQSKVQGDWKAFLVKTTDAIHYTVVTQLDVKGKPNESTVEMLKNKKMRIIVRREEANDNFGYLGYSEKDFTTWKWDDLGIRLGGPNIITLPNGKTVIGSRSYRENKAHTSLFGVDENGKAVELLEFPSGGDTSYPGLIVNKDELWVSYYSSHEGKTSIYIAKLKYKDL